ncbi:MAG TPA: hypothetical protein VIJ68_03455 [Candidatus Saccharimonadales bacterium]
MLGAFFSWWYGRGWNMVATSFKPRLRAVADGFSTRQLLKTWFAPWRRITTEPGSSIEDHWRAGVDNLFSRLVGFVVRSFVLFAAAVCLAAVAGLTAAEAIAWPLLPLAVPGCLIAGLLI